MSQSSSCFLSLALPPEAHLKPPEQTARPDDWRSSQVIETTESSSSNSREAEAILELTMQTVMPNSVWLLAVKSILLVLSVHSLCAVCIRIVRVLNQLTRYDHRLQSDSATSPNADDVVPRNETLDISRLTQRQAASRHQQQRTFSPINHLEPADLAQIRTISLTILSVSLVVSVLQIAVVWYDHFASICCSTAFALVALIGDFKSAHDPNGQLNLVVTLISKSLFAILFLLKKTNLYLYTSRPRRRFSLQQRRPMNTYTVGR